MCDFLTICSQKEASIKSLSTKLYYNRCGFTQKNAAIQIFNDSYRLKINLINSSTPDKKVATVVDMLKYFEYVNTNMKEIMDYYADSPLRKLAFQTHRKKLKFCMLIYIINILKIKLSHLVITQGVMTQL